MGRTERKYNKIKSDKNLMKLYRRQNTLYENMSKLGYRTLETPIRWGWEKKYVLRKDISRSKKATLIKVLLNMVNNSITSHNKNFLTRDWKTKKMIPIQHDLHTLSVKDYALLTDIKKRYFSPIYKQRWGGGEYLAGYGLNLPMWYFSEKISPHYIYRVRITDEEMQREYDEIWNYLWSDYRMGRVNHILGRRQNYKQDEWYQRGRVARDLDKRTEADKEIAVMTIT